MRFFASETHYMTEEQNAPPTALRPAWLLAPPHPARQQQTVRLSHRRRFRQHFLDLVEQHSEERDVRVTAYTVMSNHFPLGRGWRLPGCDLKLHDGGKLRSVSASLLPRSLFEVRVES